MPVLRVRYRLDPASRSRTEDQWEPVTFGEIVPEESWVPPYWIAFDFDYEWGRNGALRIVRHDFTAITVKSIGATSAPQVVRRPVGQRLVHRYPARGSPTVHDGSERGFQRSPR